MRSLTFALAALTTLSLGAEIQKPGAAAPAKEAKDPKEAKNKDILRLLKLLGWPASNAEAARQQLQSSARDPRFSAYPAAYWKDYEAAASPETFERILLPIFDKNYSHEDIKTFIRLVSSPEFKFFMEKNPEVKVKKEAYETFSKYMTEVGGKLREKHNVKLPGAPVKK